MSFFDSIKSAQLTNAHGEVNFFRIAGETPDLTGFEAIKPSDKGYIVGHSESGHHHVLAAAGVTVMEKTSEGMAILLAIVESPTSLKQAAGAPHAEQTVEPGTYFITNNQEYNPFTEQARRVAD